MGILGRLRGVASRGAEEVAEREAAIGVRWQDAWASEHHGVPPGRWSAVKQQWESRARSDWQVGAAFWRAYATAQREVRKRPR